jgi:hypothetical protein
MENKHHIESKINALPPEQQITWAKGKLVTSMFLKDVDGCRMAWSVLRKNRNFKFNRQPNKEWRLNLSAY